MRLILTPYDVALLTPPVEEASASTGFNSADYFRAVSTGTPGATATATVTKPTGTIDGDLLVAVFATANVTVSSVPTGWTLTDSRQNPGGNWCYIYHKVASSEGASWDWVFSANVGGGWGCCAYKGSASSTKETSGSATANSTTVASPSVTTLGSDRLLVVAGTSSGFKTHTEGSGMTERHDAAPNPSIFIYDQVVAATGATGTRTVTLSASGNTCAITAAFKYA